MESIVNNILNKKETFITVISEDERLNIDLGKLLKSKDNIVIDNNIYFSYETVYEEISSNKNNDVVDMIVKKFEITNILKFDPNFLSYGQKQLIYFLKSYNEEFKLMILINTFSAIDNYTKEIIFNELQKLSKKNKIKIINITKDPEEGIYGDRIILLNNRNVLLNEKTNKALLKENEFKKANLKLPFFADLSIKLKYYGLVDELILNKIKLVNKLWK